MTKGFFAFAITFVAFFVLTYVFLASVDALPNPPASSAHELSADTPDTTPAYVAPQTSEVPVRISIKSSGTNSRIVTPESTDIDALNKAVDTAAMHYPGSALLGENGTVLLFGHSSHLPIVNHQVYKTFNGIEKLKEGAEISVYSATTEYRYSVTGVRLANATEDVVELPSNGKFLVLVTCDNFGSKADRFVVTATFEGSYPVNE